MWEEPEVVKRERADERKARKQERKRQRDGVCVKHGKKRCPRCPLLDM